MTKRDVVDQIAITLNRPNDVILKNSLEDIVVQQLNQLLRRSIHRNGVDDGLILPFYTNLVTVDKITLLPSTNLTPATNIVSKSELKIPTVLRYNTDTPYIRVTDSTNTVYPYRPNFYNSKSYRLHLPYTPTVAEYTVVNDYIYFSHQLVPSEIVVYQVYTNPDDAIDRFYERLGYVFDDTTAFPYPADLIGDITTSILKGEISVPAEQPK